MNVKNRSIAGFVAASWITGLGLFAASDSAVAQDVGLTLNPSSLSIPSTSTVCSNGTATQRVCITLPSGTGINKVDVFFLFDDTGSFAGFVPTVRNIFSDLAANLQTAMPGVEFGFGVGRFEDYGGPGNSYSGENSDGRPFTLNQPIVTAATAGGSTQLVDLINAALLREAPGYGGDGPESAIAEGLFQIATGNGFDGNGDGSSNGDGTQVAGALSTQTSPDDSGDVPAFSTLDPSVLKSGTVGGAGFRADALKIVILATDICSIAAFDPSAPIPAEITGIGGTESTSEFACSSVDPGSSRFGFVGDSVDFGTNTVVGAVAPKGAATVPQTVAALNAAGIRVLGLVPGGEGEGDFSEEIDSLIGPGNVSTPKGSGPSFDPNPWLSAMARLTQGVDSDGDPLVFGIGSGGDTLKNNIVAGVLAAAKKPIDISVNAPDLTSSNVSLSAVAPGVVTGVAPGGQACFDVGLTGSGTNFTSAFSLNFFDVATSLSLGKVPTSISCLAEAIQCTAQDISNDQNLLDGGAAAQRDLVARIAKRLNKYGKAGRKLGQSLLAQADALYLQNWTLAYTLPSTVQTCSGESVSCVSTSNTGTLDQYLSRSNELKSLAAKGIAALVKRGHSASDIKHLKQVSTTLQKKNVTVTNRIPKTNTVCSDVPDLQN